jgi:hypothetical protein
VVLLKQLELQEYYLLHHLLEMQDTYHLILIHLEFLVDLVQGHSLLIHHLLLFY